jgi:hypothetical protein
MGLTDKLKEIQENHGLLSAVGHLSKVALCEARYACESLMQAADVNGRYFYLTSYGACVDKLQIHQRIWDESQDLKYRRAESRETGKYILPKIS